MVNPPLMNLNTKNGATPQGITYEFLDKSPVSGKKKGRLLLEIEKKDSKKLKCFQRLLE